MPESSSELSWSAYEHEHIERGSDWFWAIGIIAVSTGLTSVLFGNILFALLIISAAVAIIVIAKHPPQLHDFEITEKGVVAGHILHPYESIISFWVDTESDAGPTLLIDTTAFMSPNLVIPLGDVDPERVRQALRPHIEEKEMHEPLAHKIMEFFGF